MLPPDKILSFSTKRAVYSELHASATRKTGPLNRCARPGLNHKTRAMLSLAMTAAQGRAPAVKIHTKTCLRAGCIKKEIGEILPHAYCYAGVYASLSSFMIAKEAFAEVAGAKASRQPRRPGKRAVATRESGR